MRYYSICGQTRCLPVVPAISTVERSQHLLLIWVVYPEEELMAASLMVIRNFSIIITIPKAAVGMDRANFYHSSEGCSS